MTLPNQNTSFTSIALPAVMATSPANTGIPTRLQGAVNSRLPVTARMPKRQPNHPRFRFVAQTYSKNFSVDTTTFSQKRQTRFSAGELMKRNFPKLNFLVAGWLPFGLIMLAGSPKVGKSFFLLDLAVCIASGQPFMGRETTQGNVLYLALEDNGARLMDRLNKITEDPEFDKLPLDLWIESRRSNAGGIEEIEGWLSAAENPKLVIIDVWGRFSPEEAGGSKDAYLQTTQALQPLQNLANQYGVAIILVHHTRKSTGDGSASADPYDQVIGSRGLTSNMDATMMLTRTRMEKDGLLMITGRDIEERQFNLHFDGTTFRWNEVGRNLAPSLSPERQKVLDAIAAGCTKTGDIVAHVGKARTAVANLLKALCDDGLIESPSKGIYHLPGQPVPDPELFTDMNDLGDIAETALADLI